METGITIDDAVSEEFTKLRMKRAHRFLIFRVNDEKTKVVIEHVGAREATFAEFKELMPKDGCR